MNDSTDSTALDASNVFSVTGKVALVTGGGTGIGAMIARALASNGAKVYILGRRLEVLQESVKAFQSASPNAPGELIAIKGDVGSKDEIEAVKQKLNDLESALDILVNNAGITGQLVVNNQKDLNSVSESMWSVEESDATDIYKTNVLAPYFLSAALLPLLGRSTRNPQVINIGSVAGFIREVYFGMIYPLSKAAVHHLTKILATELKSTGVRCNAVSPGLFPSQIYPSTDDARMIVTDILTKTPAGRVGYEKEMAATILFLTSEHQNFVNGAIIPIDGGLMSSVECSY